jgi:hypothetical protein
MPVTALGRGGVGQLPWMGVEWHLAARQGVFGDA